jgi:Helix-turn-helix domain
MAYDLARYVTRYLTRLEAAAEIRLKPQTLAAWATRGCGPKYIKLGGRVLYDREELLRYLAERTVTHPGELADRRPVDALW